jgi:hypothetical protein
MHKKKRDGYVAGLACLLVFALLSYFAIVSASNPSTAVIMGIFAIFFGGLGFGSLWKPESVGAVVSQFLERLSESEEGSSDSHDKQIQKKSSGVQVMAHDQSKVTISVTSGKQKQSQNYPAEEKEFLRKETICVTPSNGYSYEFELTRGDHLRGEIVSDNPMDIYFVDEINFDKWGKNRYFEPETCNEGVFETQIDYVTPRKGTWYLILENNGKASARVNVRLYVEEA